MEQSFTKPFQSSGGICYPSTDYSKYYSQQQQNTTSQKGGSGAYSKDSLIPNLPGKDMYVAPQFERKLDSTFYNENMGVDYATAFGGKRRRRSTSKPKSKSKKTTKKTTKRKMRGGSVTGLPSQYFNASAPVASYSADSGKGMMTAYGPADPKDIGQGLLAPYNANPMGNQSSMMKTGGKKRRTRSRSRSKTTKGKKKTTKRRSSSRRKMKGGFARVPKMSDSAVTGVQKVVSGTVNTLNSFMKNLETKFNQSVKVAENVKIGEQRLIQQQGGKKKKRSTSKSKKTTKKKTTTKRRRSMKGGNGSDYATTLNSRGPANYPDNGWYKGEQLFRQFSKTGEYIPNSQLPYAAAPISTMSNPNPQNIVTGYDNLGQPWETIQHQK